jgi:hypothetical protein
MKTINILKEKKTNYYSIPKEKLESSADKIEE